jgi:hypothetical protein
MRIPVGNSRINPLTDVFAGVSGARYRCAVRFFNLKKEEESPTMAKVAASLYSRRVRVPRCLDL